MQHAFYRIQTAFDEIYNEISVPGLSWLFRGPIGLWSRINRIGKKPSDKLGHKVAQAMQQRGEQRDRLTSGIYISKSTDEAIGKYEHAMLLNEEAFSIYKKLYKATKARKIKKAPVLEQIEPALEEGIIDKQEAEKIRAAEEARYDAILVDEFTLDEYNESAINPSKSSGMGMDKEKNPLMA